MIDFSRFSLQDMSECKKTDHTALVSSQVNMRGLDHQLFRSLSEQKKRLDQVFDYQLLKRINCNYNKRSLSKHTHE